MESDDDVPAPTKKQRVRGTASGDRFAGIDSELEAPSASTDTVTTLPESETEPTQEYEEFVPHSQESEERETDGFGEELDDSSRTHDLHAVVGARTSEGRAVDTGSGVMPGGAANNESDALAPPPPPLPQNADATVALPPNKRALCKPPDLMDVDDELPLDMFVVRGKKPNQKQKFERLSTMSEFYSFSLMKACMRDEDGSVIPEIKVPFDILCNKTAADEKKYFIESIRDGNSACAFAKACIAVYNDTADERKVGVFLRVSTDAPSTSQKSALQKTWQTLNNYLKCAEGNTRGVLVALDKEVVAQVLKHAGAASYIHEEVKHSLEAKKKKGSSPKLNYEKFEALNEENAFQITPTEDKRSSASSLAKQPKRKADEDAGQLLLTDSMQGRRPAPAPQANNVESEDEELPRARGPPAAAPAPTLATARVHTQAPVPALAATAPAPTPVAVAPAPAPVEAAPAREEDDHAAQWQKIVETAIVHAPPVPWGPSTVYLECANPENVELVRCGKRGFALLFK